MPAIAILLLLTLACPIWAGVVSRDLFEPGDGLLTYDDVNQREWLDLFATTSMPVEELLAKMDGEGDLTGFNFASLDDIRGLARSAEIELLDESGDMFAAAYDAPPTTGDLFGWNIELRGSILGPLRYAYGLIATETGDLIGNSHFDGTYVIAWQAVPFEPIPGVINPRPPHEQGAAFMVSDDPWFFEAQTGPISAYWLYRDVAPVPEPAPAALALTACLAALRLRVFA